MIEFILMYKHELEIRKVTYERESFKIIFREIEFDKISTLVKGGYFKREGGMENEELERGGVLNKLIEVHGFFVFVFAHPLNK